MEDTDEVKKTFECQECGKSFWRKFNLQQHFIVHTGEKKFQCGECGKRFAHKSSLNDHVKIHNGTKDHICSECGKAFYTKSNLKQHVVRHTGEKNYQCPTCKKTFGRSSYMLTHVKLHHGADYQRVKHKQRASLKKITLAPNISKQEVSVEPWWSHSPPNEAPLNLTFNQQPTQVGILGIEEARSPPSLVVPNLMVKPVMPKPARRPPKEVKLKHTCLACGSKFTFKKYLHEHMKVHAYSEEKEKKNDGSKECTVCGKWVTNFHQHMRRHVGIKDHQCPGCMKTFFQKSNLKQHAKKRPYTCWVKYIESINRSMLMNSLMMGDNQQPNPQCIRCKLVFGSLFELVAHSHECIGLGSSARIFNGDRMTLFGGGGHSTTSGESSSLTMSQHDLLFNDDTDTSGINDDTDTSGINDDTDTSDSESPPTSLLPLLSRESSPQSSHKIDDDKNLALTSYYPPHNQQQKASAQNTLDSSGQSFAIFNLKHRAVVGRNGKKSYPCVRCNQHFNSILQLLDHSDTNKCSGAD